LIVQTLSASSALIVEYNAAELNNGKSSPLTLWKHLGLVTAMGFLAGIGVVGVMSFTFHTDLRRPGQGELVHLR